jgi:hypothetical protein
MRLHLLTGDVERDDILGFIGELMLNLESTHCVPTNGSIIVYLVRILGSHPRD